jgi:thiamine-phosphate pyrophosphorylase
MKKLSGLYLVISPILPAEELLCATAKALDAGVDILQFAAGKQNINTHFLAESLACLSKICNRPFLVNNDLVLAKKIGANGVHFDTFNVTPREVRQVLGNDAIVVILLTLI